MFTNRKVNKKRVLRIRILSLKLTEFIYLINVIKQKSNGIPVTLLFYLVEYWIMLKEVTVNGKLLDDTLLKLC